ncbi:MAG TPA: ABC transporter ATP-binding protein, partial [Anaerolineaceae bacterium]|nr:ABC transporter ATP-binding protein [Anaerolineaceae bacterium]
MDTPIIIKNLTKKFGDVVAVNNVSVTIDPGSFLTLLGPSGCGKTTLLRCISGLEDPDDGEIIIGDKLVYSRSKGISLPAGQRDLGLVFQNYALWPHMNVYKNITFALEIQKMTKEEMDIRVKESLKEVQMAGYEDRYPREMSGGQQQRIALARMLAYRPHVFLMDEPLSNLDARLRMDMRTELKRLHHISGATTVYVTHDQIEAMTMSTKIAVMKLGVIQQMETPDMVYHYPANLFVADFIGNPKVNLMPGWVSGQNSVDVGKFNIPVKTFDKTGEVVVGLRPEDIVIYTEPTDGAVEFNAYSVLPSGADTTIIARKGDTELT